MDSQINNFGPTLFSDVSIQVQNANCHLFDKLDIEVLLEQFNLLMSKKTVIKKNIIPIFTKSQNCKK